MSGLDSLLVAGFLITVVFTALCALYLFIEAFSLTFATIEFALKRKGQKKA